VDNRIEVPAPKRCLAPELALFGANTEPHPRRLRTENLRIAYVTPPMIVPPTSARFALKRETTVTDGRILLPEAQ